MKKLLLILCLIPIACSLPTESRWVVRCYDIWNRETSMEFGNYSAAKKWYNQMTFEESPPHVCYILSD